MNSYNKILTLLFVLISFRGISDNPSGYEIRGIVTDLESGKVLTNANVYLEVDGEILLQMKTKNDGSFSFKLSIEELKAEGVKVRIEKRGYHSENRLAIPGSDLDLNIQLKAKPRQVPIMVPRTSPTGQYIIV